MVEGRCLKFADDLKGMAANNNGSAAEKALVAKWETATASEPGLHLSVSGLGSIHREMKQIAFDFVRPN